MKRTKYIFFVICLSLFFVGSVGAKDRFKNPRIVTQVGKRSEKIIIKNSNVYIVQGKVIRIIDLAKKVVKNSLAANNYIKGFVINQKDVYFTMSGSSVIWKTSLDLEEPIPFKDLKKIESDYGDPKALTSDGLHLYCVQSSSIMQIPFEGDQVYGLSRVGSTSSQVILVDDTNIYWTTTMALQFREKDEDIAKVYSFKGMYLNSSMASNNRFFYYAYNHPNKNDRIMEIDIHAKEVTSYVFPQVEKYRPAKINENSIVCDEKHVYVATNNGIWYKMIAAKNYKQVEKTAGMDCVGLADDGTYLYFIIDGTLFKMTKPADRG